VLDLSTEVDKSTVGLYCWYKSY